MILADYYRFRYTAEDTHMSSKPMTACLAPLTMREMQMQPPRTRHYTAVRKARIKHGTTRCYCGRGEPESLIQSWWKCEMAQPLWVTGWQFLKKQNIQLPYDLAIALLGIQPRGMKTCFHKTCTQMFMTALFVIAPNWRPPRVFQQLFKQTDTSISRSITKRYQEMN